MMLRRWVALGIFVALASIAAACGSSTPPTPTAAPEPTPTETPQPTPTPKPEPNPTQESEPTPTQEPEAAPTQEPEPTPTEAPQLDPLDPQEADAVRQLTTDFWGAYNSYDADKALGYMVKEYRQEQDVSARSNIASMEAFRVKLVLTEEGPPQELENGEAQMYFKMQTPLGERRVHMIFRKVDGEWMVASSEEVP